MQRFIAALLCVAGLHFAAGAQSRATTAADLIFTNGKIVTLDAKTRIASAVAIGGDHILAVGTDTEALALRGSSTKVVDLRGKSVIPALEDSHIHFLGLGRDIARRADFSFAKGAEDIVKTVQELKTRINAKPGDWLMGSRWDQYKYPSMATRWQLDEVTPNNPVRLSRTYRGVLVNTAVFRLMKIDDSNSSAWPAWWLKDPANFTFEDKIFREKRTLTVDGKQQTLEIPTGVFLGRNGSALITARPPSARDFEDDVESVRLGVLEMLRLGVGSIVDADSPGDYDMRVFQEAQKRGFLLIRVPGVYFGSVYHQTPEELVKLLKPVNMNVPSDDFLRWRGTKYYADGGVGSRSAWVSEPFTYLAAEGKENYGEPEMADYDKREAQYRAWLDLGWDLHTHACGDLAVQQVVKLYMKLMDEVHQKNPKADLRWSVIHAYMPIEPKTNVLADMAKYHIIAVPNPPFQWQQGDGFATNAGPARMARMQPFRSYLKAGVIMPSGSDYPIVTHDPWVGIYALLTRRDQKTGKVYGQNETIGIVDALRSYSTMGAYLTYDEKQRGSIEVGKLADLTVLDLTDINMLEKNPELCFQMRARVVATLVGGQIRYQKSPSW